MDSLTEPRTTKPRKTQPRKTQPGMDWTSNGLNHKWTQPQMDWTPNGTEPRMGLNLEWNQPRMGLKPEWDWTPNILNPKWTQPRHFPINPFKKRAARGWVWTQEWYSTLTFLSTPRIWCTMCQGKKIVYIKRMDLKQKMFFTATIEMVPFEVDRNSQVESPSLALSPFYVESHSYIHIHISK
jgi:hypothetical protein